MTAGVDGGYSIHCSPLLGLGLYESCVYSVLAVSVVAALRQPSRTLAILTALFLSRRGVVPPLLPSLPDAVFTARASTMAIIQSTAMARQLGPSRLFMVVSAGIILLPFFAALSVDNLSVVLGVVGAVATVPVTITLPGLYLALLTRRGGGSQGKIWLGWACFLLGNILSVLCLYGRFSSSGN